MYIINITVNADLPEEKQKEMLTMHTEWIKKYFQAGKFLMIGAYIDTDAHAGVIFAHTDSRDELQRISQADCYYPDLKQYKIREFTQKMIAADIGKAIEE